MKWSDIITIPKWTPISELGFDCIELEEDFYKISENQYCLSSPFKSMSLKEELGGPFVTAFLWACGEGAAKRVYMNDIESDDNLELLPPSEILPPPGGKFYGDILKGLKDLNCKSIMEHAAYRITTDGLFIHRVIESEIASYFFRNPEHNDMEMPYAIQWNLIQE